MKKIETRGRKQMYKEPSIESKRYRLPASKAQDFHEYAIKKIKQYIRDDKKTN